MKNAFWVDELLAYAERTMRTAPGMLLLGSTGARLWVDCLEKAPGFSGMIDFVQKMNIPLLFRVEYDLGGGWMSAMDTARSTWRPSHLAMEWQARGVEFTEKKYVTWDDIAVSCQQWRNGGRSPVRLRVALPDGAARSAGGAQMCFPQCTSPFAPLCGVSWSAPLGDEGELTLLPGGSVQFVVCAAADLPDSSTEKALARALAYLAGGDGTTLLEAHRREYLRWFEQVPAFHSDDELMEKTWWYRWYILRANYARPDWGNFQGGVEFEGRSHRMKNIPYRPAGWEFSKLIPLSTPMHITELRHMRWHEPARQVMNTLSRSGDADGAFSTMNAVGSPDKEYSNYSARALEQYYLSTGDIDFVRAVLPAFERDFDAVFARHKGDGDALQIERVHQLTGKEYQPSYWYFGGYPDDARSRSVGYTPLKRVDRSVYSLLNARALAHLCALCGRDASRFRLAAAALERNIMEKMWDAETGFFYDLHYADDRKAMVKNIVGVYPFWAGLGGEEQLSALDKLLSSDLFALGSGFASAAADCPVFRAEGSWKGIFFKGRDGCMWDGPSWPYTTGIALDALALASKRFGHRYDSGFGQILREYLWEHYCGHDIDKPYLVEFYNSVTGEPLSDEPDYNHSYLIDLMVSHVAGVTPTETGFTFEPCRCLGDECGWFELDGLDVRGHRVDVLWQRCADEHFAGRAGYTLRVDGADVPEAASGKYEYRFEETLA